MILHEFDENKNAIINPWNIKSKIDGFPKIAVSCFSKTTFERIIKELNATQISQTSGANGENIIYKVNYENIDIALYMSTVGAPCCIGEIEEMFQMGCEKIILFGTCGVLDASIEDCSIIIPNSAIRDEGTSYHYAPPSDEIEVNTKYINEFIEILDRYELKYTIGKAWTTDAFYRETRDKVQRRKDQGCICVDMECSAVGAVASFREKEVFHFFYAADNLDSEEWDVRSLSNDEKLIEKDKIATIAMEMAVKIAAK
ncbi:nucleoside phosphorylase [Romboutsia sp.]|uniref:nucleoside phosphorylase n=1 Tax=Romboutsia sp. TaxID=1965302 RepID=UPI003F36EE8E